MSKVIREGFAQFSKRQQEGVSLVTDAINQEDSEQKVYSEWLEKRQDRKRKLLYQELDLILRHKSEVLATPRYADIDVHYAFSGFVGYARASTRSDLSLGSSWAVVNLSLASLLKIWEEEHFQVKCDCGGTAYIYKFGGMPGSGASYASAFCPHCKQEIHNIRNRSPWKYYHIATDAFTAEVTRFVENFLDKWKIANEKYLENLKDEHRNPRTQPVNMLRGDAAPCCIETLIQELRLKEFGESTKEANHESGRSVD